MPGRDQREVTESPLDQGVREEKVYTFDFSAAGVSVISAAPTFLVMSDAGVDVSATIIPSGTAGTFAGLIATSPEVKALTAGNVYRLFCIVTHDGGQVSELFCRIRGVA